MIEVYPSESTSISWYKQIPKHAYFRGPSDDGRFAHNFMLLSSFYFGKVNPFKEYDINPRVKLMGDSGGYQILTQNVSAEPLNVLHWQEEYCSVGMTLDVPPDEKGARDHDYFIKCLDRTERYISSMAAHRAGSTPFGLQLLNVVQGEKPNDVVEWLGRVKKYQDRFDGYAFPFRSGLSMEFIMWVVWRLLEEKPKRLHLLSATGYQLVPILSYFSHKTNTIISVDSTSHAQPAANHVFSLFNNGKVTLGRKNRDFARIPCRCPVCSRVTITELTDSHGSALGLIACHNLYRFMEWVDTVDALSTDNLAFEEYLANPDIAFKIGRMIGCGSESFRSEFLDGTDVRGFF